MLIDDEDQARRLARAICSDVLLYNAAVKDAPAHERAGLLAEPLREGRELFSSRVTPRWAHVFDGEVAELMTRQLGLQGSSSNAAPGPLAQRPSLADPVLPEGGGTKGLVFIILVLTLVAAGAAAFFLFGR